MEVAAEAQAAAKAVGGLVAVEEGQAERRVAA